MSTAGSVATGEAIELTGEEDREDMCTTFGEGSAARLSFVAVTAFGAFGDAASWRWTSDTTASDATAVTAAATLTGAAPPLKSQRKTSAIEATAPRRDGFVPRRPSSAATDRRARKISVSTAATETPSSTLISSYESP